MKLGLVCISELLRQKSPELAFKTMTRTQFLKKPREESILELSKRISHNLDVTLETIKHCKEVGIKHYRLSCKLFPLLTDKTLELDLELFPNKNPLMKKMQEIGETAQVLNISISIHPDQFVVLGSDSDEVCANSVRELNFHGYILNCMGMADSYKCPINIHPSLSNFESPEKFMNKLVNNFFKCDIGVRNRLVFENEDKGFWNCNNLYEYFHDYMKMNFHFNFPLTFDNLHDKANPSYDSQGNVIPIDKQFLKFYGTWPVEPVFHWSEAEEGTKRNHAQKLSNPPQDFGLDVTWEIEVKGKDKAFVHFIKSKHNT
jgi:UV DNA damage endonuclease